jgi:hypothetical protein
VSRYSYVLNNPLSLIDPSGFNERHGGGMVVFSWINGSRDPAGMAIVERRWPTSINLTGSTPSQPSPPDPKNPDPPGLVTNGENPSASTTSCQSAVLDCGRGMLSDRQLGARMLFLTPGQRPEGTLGDYQGPYEKETQATQEV